MAGFESFGWKDPDPAITISVPDPEIREKGVWLEVELEPTSEPVWPEDEARENDKLRHAGVQPPVAASLDEAADLTREIRVSLPDRLAVSRLEPAKSSPFDAQAFDYYGFSLPTSFIADDKLSLRRMRLTLDLSTADNTSHLLPVCCMLMPDDTWTERRTHVADVDFDLFKGLQLLFPGMLIPGVADIGSVKIDASLGWTRVHPQIQCAGLMSHTCLWLVADERISGSFTAYVVAQVPQRAQLKVTAHLHIEVRKRFLGKLRKAYEKEVTPQVYRMHSVDYDVQEPTLFSEHASQSDDEFSITLQGEIDEAFSIPVQYPYEAKGRIVALMQYPYEAKGRIVALIETLEIYVKRDQEQEVQGIAVPVFDAVVEEARAVLADDPVVAAVAGIISLETIAAGEPIRAIDALLVAKQLDAAIGPYPIGSLLSSHWTSGPQTQSE